MRRAVEFWRETDLRTAGRVEEHPLGVALFDDQLPEMWILNQLHVVRPEPELEAGALVAELDRLYGHLKHRRVTIDDDATGQRLDEGLRAHGFRPDRLGVMLLGDPPPPPPGVAREETDDAVFRAVELAVALDTREQPAEVAERLVAGRARIRAGREGTRTFVGARDGFDACTVTMYSDGSVAQLEDVATLIEHRGHGLAAATVSLAIHKALAAGHDLVFLLVELDGGPVSLYERLGFRTAGQYWNFTRPE